MRELLAISLLVWGLTVPSLSETLPLPVGSVNDYGQTLDRHQRSEMQETVERLLERGVELVYLASWHDPFADPHLYARRVFSFWGLGPDSVLLVLLRDERGRWHAAGHPGEGAAARISYERWEALRARAQSAANLGSPGAAAISWATALAAPPEAAGGDTGGSPLWFALAVGAGGLTALVLLARRLFCPHCLRPLRKARSWGGIIWLCPRCRYTRAPRRGSGPRSRGGFRP